MSSRTQTESTQFPKETDEPGTYLYVTLPDFTENFWIGVGIAAAVATALATGVATLLSALWRWRDRAVAEWSVTLEHAGGYNRNGDPINEPKMTVCITNIGDGTAYKITVDGKNLASNPTVGQRRDTDRQWQTIPIPVPLLHTGESITVMLTAASADLWDSASFTVRWWHSPTRRRRRWLGLRTAQLSEKFKFTPISDNPAATRA